MHERPEGMDVGTVVMSGLKQERVMDAINVVTSQHERGKRLLPLIDDYDTDTVSKQILRVVLSYVDYVNRTVWHKTQ